MTNPSPDTRPRALVLIPMGWSVRNYLHTGFLQRLRERMHVSVALRYRDEPLVEMLRPVVDEIYTIPEVPSPPALQLMEIAITRADLYRKNTQAFKIRRGIEWKAAIREPKTLAKLAIREVSGFGMSRLPQSLFEKAMAIEKRLVLGHLGRSQASTLLHDTRPDVVFSTGPQLYVEWPVVMLAKQRGIKVATAVLSWDNLAKGRFPVVFDRYYVWSETMREDLRAWSGTDPARIVVSGTPQFDLHVRGQSTLSRDEFCRRLSLDPKRPIVTFTASTATFPIGEETVVRDLAIAMAAAPLPGQAQLLVRLHPLDDGARFVGLAELGVRVVRPWALDARTPAWSYPTASDMDMLWGTLVHTAVNVNFTSTTTLDFSVVDKPVVNIAIETPQSRASGHNVLEGYDYEHYRRVLDNGAVALVRSTAELVGALATYLLDPTVHQQGRARLVKQICGVMDGHAGDRIAADLAAFRDWPA